MKKTVYLVGLLVLAACVSGCVTGAESTSYEGTLTELTMDTSMLPEGWYDYVETAETDNCVDPVKNAVTIDVAHAYNPGDGYITAHFIQNVTLVAEDDVMSFFNEQVASLQEQFGNAWYEQHEGEVSLAEFAHEAIGDASFACTVEIDEIVDAEEDVHEQTTTYYIVFVNKDVVVSMQCNEYPSLVGLDELILISADIAERI